MSIQEKCPYLKKIIWDDPKGMRDYDDPLLISLKEVMEKGRELDQKDPGLFEKLVSQGKAQDVALLFYTSGTTALPKGALLSHYNMLTMGQNMMKVDPCTPEDDFVSFLPFAWIGEQMMSISCGLQVGYTINFPEEPEIGPGKYPGNRPPCHVRPSPDVRADDPVRPGQAPGLHLAQKDAFPDGHENRLPCG